MISQAEGKGKSGAAEIAELLRERVDEVLSHLFPAGKKVGHEYCVGSLDGEAGASLKVHLNGKGNVWQDFATGDKGGDLLDLWKAARCGGDIRAAMREASEWLGIDGRKERRQSAKEHQKAIGGKKHAGSWIYHDENGQPWIEVHRYNLPDGKKQFLQHDLKADKWITSGGHQLPDPRPLLNLHRMADAKLVLLHEGEKCCDATGSLLDPAVFVTTTTMGGALAAEKTDFTPLAEKTVLLWPDNDDPGKHYIDVTAKKLLAVGSLPHIIPIPDGKPEGWDAVDAIAEGWTREDILNLIAKATPYEPPKLLRAFALGDFLALEIKPREHLLSPWIPSQGLVMVHSWRGTGKTLFGMGVSYALVSGGQFLKWAAPTPRRVLYVDGELPAAVLQERFAQIVRGAGYLPQDESFLRIITPDYQERGIPDLSTEEGQEAIEEHLDGVDLVVLDNLSALVRSGEENAAEAWLPVQQWILSLRRRGLSVFMLHHSGKTGTQRGTSKREDLLDVVVHLKRPTDYDPSQGARFEVHFQKYRHFYGEDAAPIEVQYSAPDDKAQWTWRDLAQVLTDQILDLLLQGMSQHAIAKELNIGVATVNRHVQKLKQSGRWNGK